MNSLRRKIAANPIIRNSFFLGLTGACRGLAEVTLVILAIRTLGPSTGGLLILGFTVIRVAQFVAEAGLGMYLTREVPRSPDMTGTYTLEAIKLVVIIAAPIGFLLALATTTVEPVIGFAIALATAAVILGAIQPILGAAFLAHDQAHWQFKNMFVMATTMIVGALLVATLAPSLVAFFIVIAVSRAAGVAVGLLDFLTHLAPNVTFAGLSARRAFGRSVPYALHAIGSYLYLRVDILLLGAIAGSLATGIYGSVADPLVSLTAFVYIITRSFLPSLSRSFGTAPWRFASLVRTMLILNLGLGTAIAAGVFLGAEWYVSLAFGDDLAPAAAVLRILSAAILLRFLNSGLATWLTASGRQWDRAKAILGGAGFNITLNLIAIPIWGYWAAAWSTVATEVVILGLLLWLLRSEIAIGARGGLQEGPAITASEATNVIPD